MEIWIWKPGRKLLRSCKSGSVGQAPTLMCLLRKIIGDWPDHGNLDLEAREEAGQIMQIWMWRPGLQT